MTGSRNRPEYLNMWGPTLRASSIWPLCEEIKLLWYIIKMSRDKSGNSFWPFSAFDCLSYKIKGFLQCAAPDRMGLKLSYFSLWFVWSYIGLINWRLFRLNRLSDRPLTGSGFRVQSFEPARGPGIYHLELLGVQVIQHVLIGLDPGPVQRGLELARCWSLVLATDGSAVQLPVPEAPVEERHRAVPEHPEHPPHAGRRERAELAGVVHHDVRVVLYPQVPHIVCEELLWRQHVVQRRGSVAALVDVKESCARDVPPLELAAGAAPLLGQIPGRVQEAHFPLSSHSLHQPLTGDQCLTRHGDRAGGRQVSQFIQCIQKTRGQRSERGRESEREG